MNGDGAVTLGVGNAGKNPSVSHLVIIKEGLNEEVIFEEEGYWLETLSTTYAFRLYKINDTTHGKAVSRDLLHGVLLIIQGAVRGECFRPSPRNIIATVQTSRG